MSSRHFPEYIPEQKSLPSFERWLSSEFPQQYKTKTNILKQTGLLETLPKKQEAGIVSIDGIERPLPSLESIQKELLQKKGYYESWIKKGFTNLEITPFGLPLKKLIRTVSQKILEHYKNSELFSGDVPLEIDKAEPFWVWPKFKQADIKEELKYFVSRFEKKQGYTKRQLLNIPNISFPGYLVYLREQNLKIPRKGQGKIIKGRKQIETGKTAEEYLELFLKEKSRGMTPEDYLTLFLTHLEETNQVIDDLDKSGGCLCVGAFHEPETLEPSIGKLTSKVPDGYFGGVNGVKFTLGSGSSFFMSPNIGARPVVEVGNLKFIYPQ